MYMDEEISQGGGKAYLKQAKLNKVKLSGFGTFSFKKTPNRIGRNPKTGNSYIIPALNKINFKKN